MSNPILKNEQRRDHAELQYNRILDAAERCFVDHGFHAASIASISDTAGLSAGLIYRYFENKKAIVLAIIARQLQHRRAAIAELQSCEDLAANIGKIYSSWRRGDATVMNPTLFLEMTAEAARDPEIAAALSGADRQTRKDFHAWLERLTVKTGKGIPSAEIRARSFLLQCFIEGLMIRAIRGIEHDEVVLLESLRHFLPVLLPFDEP